MITQNQNIENNVDRHFINFKVQDNIKKVQ
jgi:hypothetical protein